MNAAASQLSNREIALLIWLGVLLGFVIIYRPTRQMLGPLLHVALFSKVSIVLFLMLAYASSIALICHWLSLAHWWMLKDALFWFFGTATILVLNSDKAAEEEHYFKKLTVDTLAFAVVLEFVVNLYTFSLAVELALTLFLAVVAALAAVAATKDEYKPARKLLNWLLGVTGFGILTYSLIKIFTAPRSFATVNNLEDFLTPIVLTLALLPFLYGVALYSAYESLFVLVGFRISEDRDLLSYAKWQLILACQFSPHRVHRFTKGFVHNFGGIRARAEVLDVIDTFKASQASEDHLSDQ
jgi:hypothetical protein